MTPVLEDILPQLPGARVFSVLYVKDGYWHLKLSPESSELTTLSTPFGNFKWLRLPMGLKPSFDEFQLALNEALAGLRNIHIIADDILVVGEGSTDEEAVRNHDDNLIALLKRCSEKSIKLNKDKIKLRCTEVPYMGNVITASGLKPDPAKINAIVNMQGPTDEKGVRRLMGMVNYLARFMPNLSTVMEPIRKLTRDDVPFVWSKEQKDAFNEVKRILTSNQVLKYFDPKSPNLVLEYDNSRSGLGDVLLQNAQPIGYGSRS